MIEQMFEVATEFKFDVGQALLSTQALQNQVDDLSKSAGGALTSLNYLASGLVAHLGLGAGGLLGVLGKAVQLSDEFNQSSLAFANNISSNIKVLAGTIHTFNDRLSTSHMLLDKISDTAIMSGLDTQGLSRIAQIIATPLANRGKLGKNYEGAINMGKNLMLSSETVGLHPQVATESLYRALTDNMPLHGALFSRLLNTQAFKGAHIRTQHQLVGMNQDKKIDLLAKAMEQLAGDADFLSNRLRNMTIQLTILKDQVMVLLRPIGDAIKKPIVMLLASVNNYLKSHGKMIGENIAKLIGNIFEDPQKLLVNLLALRKFGADFKRSVDWSGIIVTLLLLRRGLMLMGITFGGGLVRKALGFVIEGLLWFGRNLMSVIPFLLRFIGPLLSEFVSIFAPLLFFFTIISRARAMAKLNDMTNMISLTPRLVALFTKVKSGMEKILLPLTMIIDFWAKLLAPLFQTSTWLNIVLPVFEAFASVIELLGNVTIVTMSVLSGLTYMLIGFIDDIAHMKNPFGAVVKNFKTGYEDFMKDHMGGDQTKAVVNQVTNVGKIEARFDMREQLEPDRIAFAVTTHLKKLAQNPTQGRGQSFAGAFAGNQAFAGAR